MAKTTKYWIYHHPNYQWKDGKIGKIGVTDNPERRAKQYKVDSLIILEEHTNAKEVSKREIELQKEYNYPVDKKEYWKVRRMQKKAYTPEAQKKRIDKIDFSKYDWKEIAKQRDYTKNHSMWQCHTPEARAKRKTDYKAIGEKNKKSINQYDLEGNFIKQWSSATDAANSLNLNKLNINTCCRGEQKTAHKFIWKYA